MNESKEKKILHTGDFLQLARIGNWEFSEPVNSRGIVVILPVTDEGKVVLIEQFRPPVSRKVVELPAGHVGDSGNGETAEDAARRELLEETGYEAGTLKKLAQWPVSAASSSATLSFFLAEGLIKRGAGGGDSQESITVHEVPAARVPAWLRDKENEGYLIESKIYSGLFLLEKRN